MADNMATTRRRTLGAVVVFTVLLLLAACAADGEQSTTTTTGASGSAPTTTRDAADSVADARGRVDVISNGAEPRQVLRRPPTVGTTRVKMAQTVDLTVSSGGLEQSSTSPTITQTIEVEVAPRADGRFDLRQEIVEIEIGEDGTKGGRAQMERTMDALVGMSATGVIAADGTPDALSLHPPDDLPTGMSSLLDQMEGTFQQLSTPVPDEPLGVGGSWSTTSTIDLLGAAADVDVVYTLEALDADGFEVRSTTTMHADEDQAISTGGEAGALLSFTGTGDGIARIEFGQLVGTGEGSSRAKQAFEIDGEQLEQDITTEIRYLPAS